MLNRSASLGMSTSILKALPDKLDIERHSPSILSLQDNKLSSLQSGFIPGDLLTNLLYFLIMLTYNHATSNLAIYSHETSQDKLSEA